jgi:hypothetical protein
MSEVKVNKISPRSGTEVTLGDSGDTFTIPSGATINNQGTATNFGATGSASWNTTVKTSTFTAVAGEGYFINTTGGVVTVNLPAGVAGAVVAVKDYAKTFDTYNLTIAPNGSEKIGGLANDAIISTEGIAITLIYIDSTQGWLVTDDGLQSSADNNPYIAATGGTITCSGDYKIHTFTGPGTFCVSKTASSAPDNIVSYLVVAGGGAGGTPVAGGGGAGGFRFANSTCMPGPQSSPLAAPAGVTVSATSFPITVGAGGSITPTSGASGTNSIFSTITSTGGGGGRGGPLGVGIDGGSGGGGRGGPSGPTSYPGGAGNTPPVSPSQGQPGGGGADGQVAMTAGGSGGGASAAGGNATAPGSSDNPGFVTPGGAGSFVVQTGFAGCNGTTGPVSGARYFAGGGGGGINTATPGAGGDGGTGGGGQGGEDTAPSRSSTAGTTNTGGGGGGGAGAPSRAAGSAGGSGIVIIRYKAR